MEKVELKSWEEKFEILFKTPERNINPAWYDLIKSFITSELSRREAEVREAPMGVSQWREHGKKYQYWDFFVRRIREEIVKEIQDYIGSLPPAEYSEEEFEAMNKLIDLIKEKE